MPAHSRRRVSPAAARFAAPALGGSSPATGGGRADGQETEPDRSQEGAGAGDEGEAGAEAGQETGSHRRNGTAPGGSPGRPGSVAAYPNAVSPAERSSATSGTRSCGLARRRRNERLPLLVVPAQVEWCTWPYEPWVGGRLPRFLPRRDESAITARLIAARWVGSRGVVRVTLRVHAGC